MRSGSHTSLIPGCRSSLSPAVHPCLRGQGKGCLAPRATHSSKHSCHLMSPFCRKPLTQPPESAAASRHHPKSHSRPAAGCRSKSISTPSHGSARAGASSQRGTTARGDGGHLGHSRAVDASSPAGLLLSQPPGTHAGMGDPVLVSLRAAQHGREPQGPSGVLWESHWDHTGPPCDRSCGSLAVSGPRIAREHKVLLNELQF